MAFEKSGVQFEARGIGSYLGDLNKANQAQQALAKSAGGFTTSFGQASNSVKGFGSSLSGAVSSAGGFGSALGNIAQVAGGIVTAQIFNKMAEGVGAFISQGFEAVNTAQQLEMGLKALLTQNNLYERVTTTTTVAVEGFAQKQADAEKATRELTAEIKLQEAQIQEQKERIRQVTDEWGTNGLETIEQTARLGVMEEKLRNTKDELTNLSTAQQEYTTVTSTSYETVSDLATAQAEAAKQSEDLLGFVDKLSILSPFESEDVALVTQYAVGAGLGVEATKAFTAGFLDMGAAVGLNSPNLAEAAYQLLQVKKAGVITAIDLRQLSTRGIDLARIIGVEMGMSVDEFNAKAAKSPEIFDELIGAITRYSENTFAGTSAAMATSLSGLGSTMSDIFKISAKNLLRPLVEAVSPTISEMLSRISTIVTGPELAAIGQDIGNRVAEGLEIINTAVTKVMGAFSRFGLRGATVSILGQLGLDPDQISSVMSVVDQVTTAIDKITGAFERFGLKGATVSIMGMLGIDPTTIGTIFTTIDEIIAKVGIVSQVFQEFGAQGAAVSILSILGLSPETIGLITTTVQTIITTVNSLATWWIATWPTIQAAALTGWEIIKGVFAGFQNVAIVLQAQLSIAFANITQGLTTLGLDWGDVWNALKTATGIVLAGIGVLLVGLVAAIGGVVTGVGAAVAAMTASWAGMAESFKTVIEGLAMQFTGFINLVQALFAGDWALAWESFKLIVSGAVTTVKGILQGLLTAFTAPFSVILNTIGGFATGVIAVFEGLYSTLIGNSIIPDLVNGIVKWFRDLPQKILSGLSGMVSKVTKPFKDMVEGIKESVDIEELIVLGENIMDGMWEGLKSKSLEVIEWLKSLIPNWIQDLTDIAGAHSPATITMPLGASLVQGLIAGAQSEDFASQFIDTLNIGSALRASLVSTGQRQDLRNYIRDLIPQYMDQIAAGTFDAATLQGAIAQGTAGLNQSPQAILDLMAQHGFSVNSLASMVQSQFQALMEQMRVESLNTAVQVASNLSGLATSFAGMVQSQMGDIEAIKKGYDDLASQVAKLTTEYDKQSAKLTTLQEEIAEATLEYGADSEQVAKLKEEMEALTMAMDENATAQANLKKQKIEAMLQALTGGSVGAATVLNEEIAALQEFLASEDAFLTGEVWDEALGEFLPYSLSRETAQIKLNELLAEQAAKEEEIRKAQEAQAQLKFLQDQINLIKAFQDIGAEIPAGLTFGIDASADDLLAATNALVAAMIADIDDALGIASPSKVMKKIGLQTIRGMTLGVEAGQGMLDRVMSGIPLLNMAMSPLAMPAYAGGGDTYNANVNYGGVNINNGMDENTFYQRTERAVTRGFRH